MKPIRKTLSLVLAVLLVFNLTAVGASAAGVATFEVETTQGQRGDTGVQVEVRINNNPGVASVKISIAYDATRLELAQAPSVNSAVWAGGIGSPIQNNPIVLNWVGGTQTNTTENSVFSTLVFNILENAPTGNADISITYDPDDVCDVSMNNVNFAKKDGYITVLAAPISSASVEVSAPSQGDPLATSVGCGSNAYAGTIEWYEGEEAEGETVSGDAGAETIYTAKITLTPASGESFAETVAVSVNGDDPADVDAVNGTVTVIKTFPRTAGKQRPTCAAPSGLTATYGQTLADVTLSNPSGNTAGSWEWNDPTASVGNAGTNTFKATFTPTDTTTFAVVDDVDVAVAVSAKSVTPTVTVTPASYPYTGSEITPTTVTVKDGDTVIAASEYALSCSSNVNVGTAVVTVTDVAGGNYALEETTANFTITQATGSIVIQDPGTIIYDGSAVECGDGKDLSYTYTGDGTAAVKWYADNNDAKGSEISAPTNAGTYWIGVSATAGTNYEAVEEVTRKFSISPKPVSGATIGSETLTYSGAAQTPTNSVTIDGLTADGSWSAITNVGEASTFTASGNFIGSLTKSDIMQAASVSTASFSAISAQTYSGNGITPEPTVTVGGRTLSKGADFTFSYENNQYVGTGTVKISGTGNYADGAETTFSIVAADQTIAKREDLSVVKGGTITENELKANITGAVGDLSFAVTDGDGGTMSGNDFAAGDTSGKTVTITATASAKSVGGDSAPEYNAATTTFTISVVDKYVPVLTWDNSNDLTGTYGGTLTGHRITGNTGNGTVSYSSGDSSIVEVNAATGALTIKAAGGPVTITATSAETATYVAKTATYTVTVDPKVLTKANLEYTGAAIKKVYDGTVSCDLDAVSVKRGVLIGDDTLNVSGTAVYDSADVSATKVTFTPAAIESGNYRLAATETLNIAASITPKPLTIASAAAAGRDYEKNNKNVTISGVTFNETPAPALTTGYTVTGVMADDQAGIGKTVNVTVKLKSGNWSLSNGKTTTTVDIAKITSSNGTTSTTVKYSNTGAQTVALGNFIPADCGTISSITIEETSDNASLISADGLSADKSAKTATFKLEDGLADTAAGNTATLTATVTTNNYNPFTVTITVAIAAKDVPTVTAGNITKTFDNEVIENSQIKGTAKFNGRTVAGTWSFKGAPTLKNVADSGTKTVVFTPEDESNYAVAETTIVVTINKATPSGKPAYTKINETGKTLEDADLDVGTITPVGSISWNDDVSTTVEKNKSYGWTFTPTDEANYNNLTGSLKPWSVAAPSYGSTELASTDTKENADGSTTTTVTDPATGATTETTKYTDGATAVVTTAKDGSVTIAATVPAGAVASAEKNGKAVKVSMPPVKAAENAVAAPAVTINLPTSSAKVEVPVEQVTPGTVAVIVQADGTEEVIHKCIATENGVMMDLENGSTIKIIDNTKKFSDIPQNCWYTDAVAFVSSRELFEGTDAKTFSPTLTMSRGMMATVLYRMEHTPEHMAKTFADVETGKYYSDAVIWAADAGLVTGYGDGSFGPDDPITREQLITFLWRYAGEPVSDRTDSLNEFSDRKLVSDYAEAALQWAVKIGIIQGKGNGVLDPKGTAQRCEVATLLTRYLKLK